MAQVAESLKATLATKIGFPAPEFGPAPTFAETWEINQ